MNKTKFIFSLLLLVTLGFTGCDKEGDSNAPANGYFELTDKDAVKVVFEGYESAAYGFSVYKPEATGAAFYIKEKALQGNGYEFAKASGTSLSDLGTMPQDFATAASVEEGACYWLRYKKGFTTYATSAIRIAYIMGNSVGAEYKAIGVESIDNANDTGTSNYATRLEIPALNSACQFVAYEANKSDDDQTLIFNYALEYAAEKHHSNWVAFSFDPVTSLDPAKRSNKWEQDDPNIDNAVEPTEKMHKSDGFDKGHLVASEDRTYSKMANEQTFYYANISPQIGCFNQQFWAKLEDRVRTWGRSTVDGVYDEVYITKGGTLGKGLANFTGQKKANDSKYPTTDADALTLGGLFCPSYYFMAVLAKKGGDYQAIGFLVPHSELLPSSPKAGDLQVYAVSIDKLEAETGIDFFCNLPNDTEEAVQASYDKEVWAW